MPQWVILSFISLALWGVWGLFAKLAAKNLSPQSLMVFSGIGGLVITFVVLASLNFRPGVHAKGVALALLAGLVGSLGTIPFLYAISKGKASIVVPMTALYPLVTIILSALILREAITLNQGLGILFALIAIILFSL